MSLGSAQHGHKHDIRLAVFSQCERLGRVWEGGWGQNGYGGQAKADQSGKGDGAQIWPLGLILTPVPRPGRPNISAQICTKYFACADPTNPIGLAGA